MVDQGGYWWGRTRRRGSIAMVVLLLVGSCSGDGDTGQAEREGPSVITADPSEVVGSGRGSGDGRSDEIGPEDDADDAPGPLPTDTVVWTVGPEPPGLVVEAPNNGLRTASWIREGLLESLYGVDQQLTYKPELAAGQPRITARDDNSVVMDFELRSDLEWSDGTPLTTRDVAYTHEILTEGCQVEADGSLLDNSLEGCVYIAGDRIGIDQITGFEVVSDTRFRLTMSSFYADWPRLYSPVLAAHAHGRDAAEANRLLLTMIGSSGPLPTSGPFVVESWEQGRSMTLVPNESYHGAVGPDGEPSGAGPVSIDFRIDFESDPAARIEAVLDGRADLAFERVGLHLDELTIDDRAFDLETRAVPTADYDHWGFNLLNPHLAVPDVRAALALAIDKGALVDELYRPLAGDGPGLSDTGLGNTYWVPGQPSYVDHQEQYAGAQVDAALAALARAGYGPGPDGIQRHPTRGRLTLRITTIGGDPLREAQQMILVDQLSAIGIEVEIDNPTGGQFFRTGPFAAAALAASASGGSEGDPNLWDVAQFGWVGGPWPGRQSGAYRRQSPGNPYGYDNPEFQARAFECDAIVDATERDECYNDLDRFVTTLDQDGGQDDGLFMIPLTPKPPILIWGPRLQAVPTVVDGLSGGPLVNAAGFALIDRSDSERNGELDDELDGEPDPDPGTDPDQDSDPGTDPDQDSAE